MKETVVCSKCVLPSTFPHISFNENKVCNFCQKHKSEDLIADRKKYKQKFLKLIEEKRKVVVAYSGGKDSTYTNYLLKNVYGLNVVTFTFDNHFISPQAWDNIRNVTQNLGIDSIIYHIDKKELFKLFRTTLKVELFSKKALERASNLCTACSGIFKSLILSYAIEVEAPLIAFGWSPGQAPVSSSIAKYSSSFTEATRKVFVDSIQHISSDIAYDVSLKDYEKSYIENHEIYNVHPLAFEDYNENEIKRTIKTLGWVEPEDVDTNSTNCRVNCLANNHHINMYGYHPYVWEIANMVRQGTMSREEGMEKIYNNSNNDVSHIMEELHEK
jgi:hypothetical protein